jgi:hypothetical protein
MNSIPVIKFQLREWEERDFQPIRDNEQKIKAIARKAGKGSDHFLNACRKQRKAAMTGHGENIETHFNKPVDVRAFTYLLASSDEFTQRVKLTRKLLDELLKVRSPLSRLTLMQLIRAFLLQFDRIVDEAGLADWCEFIKFQLANVRMSGNASELQKYAQHKELIFSPAGPSELVKYAQQAGIDFDGILKKFSLTGFSDGRFLNLCRYQYYLETLRKIKIGEEHPVLIEVCNPDVVGSGYGEDKQLGHAILEILIDRSAGKLISEAWQNTILTIAGDPRVPKSNANYQRWWALLGEERIALMRGWLSRFDLTLFLKALEQSAKDQGIASMERMFGSRKIFMEGLLEAGIVTDSRLFLSRNAEAYLKRHFDKKELPDYARVSSSETSMIYLNLSGKAHMIEGSHDFELKLFDWIPSKARFTDYRIQKFEDKEFRRALVRQYSRECGSDSGILAVTHDKYLNWQHKAINFLVNKGIIIETVKLIPKNRYREYKEKFGVRY